MGARLREHFHMRELRYPSNWLSLLRLLLIPVAGTQLRRPDRRGVALLISAVAMVTDMADGALARRRGEISVLGKVLDPIADKLFINTIVAAMVTRGELPRWVLRLLLLRDAAIIFGSAILFRQRAHIAVSDLPGKLTTGTISSALLLYMLNAPRWGQRLLYASLLPLTFSWLQYTRKFLRLMRGT